MTEQQIRETYNQLFSATDNDTKRSGLEQLRIAAEQLGLKDWVQAIDGRLASVNEQYDVVISLSTALIDNPKTTPELKSMAFYNRMFVYDKLDPPRTEEKIADCTAIIEMPDAPVEQKARALVSRGCAYGNLEPPRTEDMIADCIAVIEMADASVAQKAWALNNRGVGYGHLEPPRTKDEIADYTAVIEMADVPVGPKACALINRGISYGKLEPPRTEDGIADYTVVIEMVDVPVEEKATALHNRGNIYKWKGELGKAKGDLLEAKKGYEEIGNKDRIKSVDFLLSRLDAPKKDLSQEDQEMIRVASSASSADEQTSSIEKKIIKKLTAKKATVYEEYNEQGPSSYINDANAENEVILSVLKGWGSAVPLVLGGEGGCRGGGYFLKYNGKGLALDPGHDFLMNFHDLRFHLNELDAVLVSHNHPDHMQDLKSIDDVKYELSFVPDNKPKSYSLVLDIDTDKSIEEWTKEPRDFRKSPIRADANRQKDVINLHDENGLPYKVQAFKAKHTVDVPNAVGYRVNCMKDDNSVLTVGFSCDTEYFPELCDENHLGGCDILVAHMSEPEIEELSDPVNAEFKKKHLGYRGTIELIKNCKPKLTIVSEFWAGLADTRIMLLQGLRKRCDTDNILPGGVGLLVKVLCNPMSFKIRCTNCQEWTEYNKIKVGSPNVPFGPLSYLCPYCCL